jgi:hypothetical protein
MHVISKKFFPPEDAHELVRILTLIGLLPERVNPHGCKACGNPQMGVMNEDVLDFPSDAGVQTNAITEDARRDLVHFKMRGLRKHI